MCGCVFCLPPSACTPGAGWACEQPRRRATVPAGPCPLFWCASVSVSVSVAVGVAICERPRVAVCGHVREAASSRVWPCASGREWPCVVTAECEGAGLGSLKCFCAGAQGISVCNAITRLGRQRAPEGSVVACPPISLSACLLSCLSAHQLALLADPDRLPGQPRLAIAHLCGTAHQPVCSGIPAHAIHCKPAVSVAYVRGRHPLSVFDASRVSDAPCCRRRRRCRRAACALHRLGSFQIFSNRFLLGRQAGRQVAAAAAAGIGASIGCVPGDGCCVTRPRLRWMDGSCHARPARPALLSPAVPHPQ